MSNNIEGIVFGDFSGLEVEERTKINHVLRDGSTAVELYWNFQDNGFPVGAVPNGPSSLSPEERACIEQQKLHDFASSIQNIHAFSANITLNNSSTELSLTPENNFVFRADTPPTSREVSQQPVVKDTEHVNSDFRRDSSTVFQNLTDTKLSQPAHQSEKSHSESPDIDSYVEETQDLQSVAHLNTDEEGKLSEREVEKRDSVRTPDNIEKTIDGDSSLSSKSTSQKQYERRNRKKRPPNYYENRDKENTVNSTCSEEDKDNIVNSTCSEDGNIEASVASSQNEPSEVEIKPTDTVNNGFPPVNNMSQTFSHNVPIQTIPPEIMAQLMPMSQQQYVQFCANYMATASMDPQYSQHQHHHQQQMAIAAMNAMIQQGLFPVHAPPPHLIQPVGGQVPLVQPAGQQYLADAQVSGSDRDIAGNGKLSDYNRASPAREDMPQSQAATSDRHELETQSVRPPQPKQELPPNNSLTNKPTPNVPQPQHLKESYSAKEQILENQITFEYETDEKIEKFNDSGHPTESLRTESGSDSDKGNTKIDSASQSDQGQYDGFESTVVGNPTRDTEATDLKNVLSEISSGFKDKIEFGYDTCPDALEKPVLNELTVQNEDSKIKTTEQNKVPVDEIPVETSVHTKSASDTSPSVAGTGLQSSTAKSNPTPVAPAKPSVWGAKPGGAGAWADLFKNTETAAKSVVIYADRTKVSAEVPEEKERRDEIPEKPIKAAEDKAAKPLGEILLKHEVSHRPYPLQPRGLVNRGNWCYVNATLQALLACPPFYHLIKALPSFPTTSRGPTSTPVIDALVDFVAEFGPMPTRNEKSEFKGKQNSKLSIKDIVSGSPFEPIGVYKMLHVIKHDAEFKQGRQEDAEEFLTCVLNGLHEEMVAALNVASGKVSPKKKKVPTATLR